ncbi:hypothetical protein JW968_02155 [Candidatus Woesearchaeota archaeon]|nr:hypothetical protein [Candidatus Woesearchaeota archaeon]
MSYENPKWEKDNDMHILGLGQRSGIAVRACDDCDGIRQYQVEIRENRRYSLVQYNPLTDELVMIPVDRSTGETILRHRWFVEEIPGLPSELKGGLELLFDRITEASDHPHQ